MQEKISHERLRELLDYDPDTGVFRRRPTGKNDGPITVARLKEILEYDPTTGVFVWKEKTAKKIVVGTIAGVDKPSAYGTYRVIAIDGIRYAAARLAWFWVYEQWPTLLRFKDKNTLNCAVDNLDDVGSKVTVSKTVNRTGTYAYIRVDGKDYLASRLAWFWVHGKWPALLRFRDGDRNNLRLANLRDTTEEPAYSRTDQGKYEARKAHYEANRDRARDHAFQAKFGITLARYNELLAVQNGVCAICKEPETATRLGKVRWLNVDHNHDTNAVRELLCHACNVLIGYARENPDILRAAIAYLERHNGGS